MGFTFDSSSEIAALMTMTPMTFFNVEPIAQQLANGLLLLTPNQRLASRISNAYAVFCAKNGHKVVVAPYVQSLEHWLDSCWEQLLCNADQQVLAKRLMTPEQELCLWQQVIADSDAGATLLRPASTAGQLRTAYNTLHEWGIDYRDSDISNHFSGQDDQIVQQWFVEFDSRCQQESLIAQAQKTHYLQQAFADRRLATVENYALYGFEDLSPALQSVLAVAGVEVKLNLTSTAKKSPSKKSQVRVVACDALEQEAQAAAAWARQLLRVNADSRIAIVIPDLAQDRARVLRLFQEVFEADFSQASAERRNTPFNFSAGYPLIEAPVICGAMQGLALLRRECDVEQLLLWLQSPFFNFSASDQGNIAWLIKLIKNDKQFQLTATRLRHLVDKIDQKLREQGDDGWVLADQLLALANLARVEKLHVSRFAEQWVGVINHVLKLLGWPGSREPDTIEYQELKQWLSVLQRFSGLSQFSKPMSFNDAINQLSQLLTSQQFQPEAPESSLQVLGLLEAAGLEFDHLWLSSMSAAQWPPSPSPNPLLPFSLQREYQMPHASAERELHYATQLSLRFLNSAPDVIVSYATTINDNPAQVSRLYKDYPQLSLNELLTKPLPQCLPLAQLYHNQLQQTQLENFIAGEAPCVASNEAILGGSSLFSSQAACPFKAFSKHRLGLRNLEQPQLGLNAADRGSILHRALELVWMQLKNSDALHALSNSEQVELCEQAAQYTLDDFSQRQSVLAGSRFMAIEHSRLSRLLDAWLNVERQRSPFTVLETESKHVFRFQQLELNARIDRVDQLSDGSYLIIDYKTGKANINAWWGSRPDDPQLPLYGHIIERGEAELSSLAFAQVRLDGCEFKGVGDESVPEPKLQWNNKVQSEAGALDWPDLKQQWQQVLNALANDFVAGVSRVDPKHPVKSCQYCDYAAVCRVNVMEQSL